MKQTPLWRRKIDAQMACGVVKQGKGLKIKSSNLYLTELMAWAQQKAGSFVMTGQSGPINKGDGGKWYGPSRRFSNRSRVIRRPDQPWAQSKPYMPSCWAGYHDRTAFYIRDFVHQAAGAAYLGYHEENYHMMKCFVDGACAETGWYAPWALNFDGSVYYMDTPNHRRFVRELTAQYELVETICRLYFLTGDCRYLEGRMRTFSERILGAFTECHDGVVFPEKNGIPEGHGNIWIGSASYNESGRGLAEAGDSIAALYQALNACGRLRESLGDQAKAAEYFRRAEALREYFNDVWSVPPCGSGYVFGVDKKGKRYWHWSKSARGITGAETCFFLPMKLLTEPGERNDRLLDEIDRMAGDPNTAAGNIESFTYLPQVFFPYHQAQRAWRWMKYIGDRRFQPHIRETQGRNEDYPELSFTMISAAIEGLLGLSADVPAGKLTVCPCLPEEIPNLSVNTLLIGDDTIDIDLPDHFTAILTNRSARPLCWKCAFAGQIDRFTAGETEMETYHETVNGVARSFIELSVEPNCTVEVCATKQMLEP